MPCVILAISVAQREGIFVMSKLSFVALSLQTTHLDPASVSKASYVKLVDGNITRQDEIPILPPTNKQHKPDLEDAHDAPTPWNEALEQLRMMVGKLPIVSYYRDADKEIYQAASRHLNIEPPAFHWLDCRELARKLLPDLADVQLSTVLKTLDLYRDYADSSAVVQTAQIVTALAERHDVNTVRELWHELYHQPEELLGLDTTFEGAAESGSSSDDEERVEGPLAAEVLPLAPEQGNSFFSRETSPETVVSHTEHEAEASTPDLDDSVEQPTNTQDRPEEASHAVADQHLPMASSEQNSGAVQVEQPDPDPSPRELPEFLQEPHRDDEILETTEAFDAPSEPVSSPGVDLTVGSEPSETAALDHDQRTVESPSPLDSLEQPIHNSPDETPLEMQSKQPQDTADEAPFEAQDGIKEPAFLQETALEELEQHDPGTRSGPEAESLDVPAIDLPPMRATHLTDASSPLGSSQLTSTPSSMGGESAQPRQTQMSVSERPMDLDAIKVTKIPPIPAPSPESSRTNQVFCFLGLFVFGVLSIIGVVLTVMAVMLFFTENSLMLETKIAGVILTVAITLLSLLMTNVSYRSFRRK